MQISPRVGNRLLDALPSAELERLLPRLERRRLAIREVVVEVGEPIAQVCFPLSGVVSLVTPMLDGSYVEVTTVGNEGMVGVPVFLGARSATVRAFSQVPGEALMLDADAFRSEAGDRGALHALIQRYTQALFGQIAQVAGCNRLHSNEERCARWLLMSHDRVGADDFPMTHEFLSQMLGVRRATVTLVALALQKAELIRYTHGRMTILDREGLEALACECYAVIKTELDAVVG